jgi:hypothetical protein
MSDTLDRTPTMPPPPGSPRRSTEPTVESPIEAARKPRRWLVALLAATVGFAAGAGASGASLTRPTPAAVTASPQVSIEQVVPQSCLNMGVRGDEALDLAEREIRLMAKSIGAVGGLDLVRFRSLANEVRRLTPILIVARNRFDASVAACQAKS